MMRKDKANIEEGQSYTNNAHKEEISIPQWYEDSQVDPMPEETNIEYLLMSLEQKKVGDANMTCDNCNMDPCICDDSHKGQFCTKYIFLFL